MKEHIILIGFMGAGKTTVGRALARRLEVRLLDTDNLIEKEAGMTISHMFETQGEEAFRRAETEMLRTLSAAKDKAVISVGGGLPLREENRELLKNLGTVIYLQVQPDTVLKRLKGDTTRPLLKEGEVREKVMGLLEYRTPIYREAAHMVVETDCKTVAQIVEEIMERRRQA